MDRTGNVVISLSQTGSAITLASNGGSSSLGFIRESEAGSAETGDMMEIEPRGPQLIPVPMNLFSTWEVDRCAPDCVPRLCSLTLKKLLVLRELDHDLSSVVIAVKLQGSKRVLRSNEYMLPSCGVMEADLELTFSMQYPHFLKRDTNKLQIMLQRRKRYKNRTILGYKSLAIGTINMAEVMQHPPEGMRSLALHSSRKEHTISVAEISIFSLSSQPIDHEEVHIPQQPKTKRLDIDRYWEEDEDDESFSSEPDGSDECTHGQHNFKQKFVSLLKKFKVNDDSLDAERVCREQEEEELGLLYDSLDECNNSESGFDLEDNDSVMSTPKPTLRRYFEGISNSGSQTEIVSVNSQKGQEKHMSTNDTESTIADSALQYDASTQGPASDTNETVPAVSLAGDHSSRSSTERVPYLGLIGRAESQIIMSPRQESRLVRGSRSTSMKDHQNSRVSGEKVIGLEGECPPDSQLCSQVPRKSVFDELNQILGSEQQLPESIILLSATDWQGQYIRNQLIGKYLTVSTCGPVDVQVAFSAIITRIQRYCNTNSLMPPPVRVLVVGDQSYLSVILRFFVEQLGGKTSDWLNYLRFLIVPLGSHPVAKYLASVDSKYNSLFMDAAWRDIFSQAEPPISDCLDVAGRVSQYVSGASVSHQLTISEAMLTYRQRSADDESCQKFVPFIGVVKVGIVEQPVAASDSEEGTICNPSLMNSTGVNPSVSKDATRTPPPSPSVSSGLSTAGVLSTGAEIMGLQVDYWQLQGADRRKDSDRRDTATKNTMKSNFRSLQVSRLPAPGDTALPHCMAMTIVTQEKNKKVMFLTKKPKEKEAESRSQVIEGISRLICTARNQNTMLKVSIDGVEWNDVKFFQLAAQWPTHVKQFPLGIFGYGKSV